MSPPEPSGEPNKHHMSSIVREISQARLRSVRRRKSGPSMSLSVANNGRQEGGHGTGGGLYLALQSCTVVSHTRHTLDLSGDAIDRCYPSVVICTNFNNMFVKH